LRKETGRTYVIFWGIKGAIMRASMSKKSLIIGTFLFLLLLLAGNASSEVEPIYAGWTVGDRWDDGSGTGLGALLFWRTPALTARFRFLLS